MKTYDLFGEAPEAVEALKLWPTPNRTEPETFTQKRLVGSRLTTKNGSDFGLNLGRMVHMSNPSTYSSADSPAKISAWQERARALTEAGAVFGGKCIELLVSYDPATWSWKTSLPSLFGDYLPYSERFPKSGMMRNGKLYQRPRLVPRTLEKGSSLWPTPRSTGVNGGPGARVMIQGKLDAGVLTPAEASTMAEVQMWPTPQARDSTPRGAQAKRFTDPARSNDLPDAVAHRALFPTPTSRDWKSSNASPDTMQRNARPLNETVTGGKTGSLNADWVSLLMGFLKDWTDIGTPKKPTRRSPGKKDGKTARPERSDGSLTASTD